MANSTLTMITSITMIVLFSVAIIGFSIGFADDNSASIKVTDNPNVSSLNINMRDELSDLGGEAEQGYASIVNTTLETGSDVIKSPAVFTITWSNLFKTFSNILTLGYSTIFGSGSTFGIFLTSLLTILGIMFTLYIIKAWRGNP